MKKFVVALMLGALLFALTGCMESDRRALKAFKSDLAGGLDRTVTVYSYDGTPIKSWSGKFDVSDNDAEVYFDVDGKTVIIHGGVVINEED